MEAWMSNGDARIYHLIFKADTPEDYERNFEAVDEIMNSAHLIN